jgi:hypothetical protein
MMTDRKWRASPIESSGFSDINVPHYDPQMSGLRRLQPFSCRAGTARSVPPTEKLPVGCVVTEVDWRGRGSNRVYSGETIARWFTKYGLTIQNRPINRNHLKRTDRCPHER